MGCWAWLLPGAAGRTKSAEPPTATARCCTGSHEEGMADEALAGTTAITTARDIPPWLYSAACAGRNSEDAEEK